MKVDRIIKNAKIYTVNKKQPWASALAIKDGKFVYVGNDAGLAAYEGEVTDAEGRFIMPGIVEAHTHVGYSIRAEVAAKATGLTAEGKPAILEQIRTLIEGNPGQREYNFLLSVNNLHGESIKFEELDAICDAVPVKVTETEQHSIWCNTKYFKRLNIDDYAPDLCPGYCVYERDPDGRINGRIYEMCTLPDQPDLIDDQIYYDELDKYFDWCKKHGIVAIFDAGVPAGCFDNAEQFYRCMSVYDKQGKLPMYMEAGLHLVKPYQLDNAVETLREFGKKYNTEHFKVRTMKIQTDGTFNGRTACVTEPYLDNGQCGGTLVPYERLEAFMLELNEAGIDFHLHAVGDRTVHMILDAVESCRKKLGDKFKIQVTIAHIEQTPDEDIERFAELGVIADYTPFWFGGCCISGGIKAAEAYLGYERAHKMYRAASVYNTGAIVNFSCDCVAFFGMNEWNPYLGIEVGITRQFDLTAAYTGNIADSPVYPNREDSLSLAQMIEGYTINGAKMLRLDDRIGSIEVGKDASFNVFKDNLFDVDCHKLHEQLPEAFFIQGVQQ